MSNEVQEPPAHGTEGNAPAPPRRARLVPVAIVAGVAALLALGQMLFHRASAQSNRVALASSPKAVTVAPVEAADFRPSRRYVGTLEPWVEARVGPQLIAAYVRDVLVRPGAVVHRGDVLATLDCSQANATSRAVAEQARALAASQTALAHQATRMNNLVDGGFVAPNEAEQHAAESESERARLMATQAQLAGSAVAVRDCVLRAPFDGEVGARLVDPGAFARPGAPLVSVVDRSVVRATADVPETDFAAVAPGTPVRLRVLAADREIAGTVTRRSPAADPDTRTVHIEVDVPDPTRQLPVNTTAEFSIDVGRPVRAAALPLTGADVRGERAQVFVAERGVARSRRVRVLGEAGGTLFVDPSGLAPGSEVVTEGRAMLSDGDPIQSQLAGVPPDGAPPSGAPAAAPSGVTAAAEAHP